MRRWPQVDYPFRAPPATPPQGPPAPATVGDIINPFLVSGGAGWFQQADGFDPRPAGVQVVAWLFVPRGRTGFVKQLRVAPFLPPVFVDPWETSGFDNANTTWRNFSSVPDVLLRPGARNGVWETPFGWESYFDEAADPPVAPPSWQWSLRFVQNDQNMLRRRAAFNPADSTTWFLVPDVAVPASAYASGLPGNAPGPFYGGQRVQVLQGDELTQHVLIPENHTAVLFVQWTQAPVEPTAVTSGGEGATDYFGPTYPLLPSFGQLLGYTQATDRDAATHNAQYGWGG